MADTIEAFLEVKEGQEVKEGKEEKAKGMDLVQFNKLLSDFCLDLSRTFPEYRHQWIQWEPTDIPEPELAHVLEYMCKVFPERFFDILYQNEKVFLEDLTTDVCFLPGVDFRVLYSLNISETTKQTLWRYLQLILFQIMEEVKNKTAFGESANMFDSIKEEDLQQKLKDTFDGLQTFFQSRKDSETEGKEGEEGEEGKTPFSMPNMENMQEHLKKLMDGRIGSLVKELMEDLKDDFGTFQEDMQGEMESGGGVPDMGNMMKKLMKDPTKVMGIMKKVTDKLKTHMTADNQQEYMHETMDILKDMGGKEEFMKMFEQMKHTMGGAGKGMRVDQNALARMEKQSATRDRMRAAMAAKGLEQRPDGTQVFKIPGEEQQKSTQEEVERIMKEMGFDKPVDKKKKSKGKKAPVKEVPANI